jgi:hypothetical protein
MTTCRLSSPTKRSTTRLLPAHKGDGRAINSQFHRQGTADEH